MKRFKLVNTTVKPPRLHPKTGADLRPAVERVGHDVEVILDNGSPLRVEKHRPRIVDHLNEGMYRMQRGGFIRIEEIEDVTAILKKHTMDHKDSMLKPDENVKYEELAHQTVENKTAKAVLMGATSSEDAKKLDSKSEGAVNPDGEPNFVVTAPRDMKVTKKVKPVREESSSEDSIV